MLHTVYKLASIQNDAREQRFDVTVATVAAVAVRQISYCMVSRDHMGILAVSPHCQYFPCGTRNHAITNTYSFVREANAKLRKILLLKTISLLLATILATPKRAQEEKKPL